MMRKGRLVLLGILGQGVHGGTPWLELVHRSLEKNKE